MGSRSHAPMTTGPRKLRCPAGKKDVPPGGFGLQKHRENQLSDQPHFSLGEESGNLRQAAVRNQGEVLTYKTHSLGVQVL